MKLWEPSMCCCFSLRTGSLIIGFLSVIGSCLSIIKEIAIFLIGDPYVRHACEKQPNPEECVTSAWNNELGKGCSVIVVACFHIICGSLLLHGIFKQKTGFFIPLMIVYAVQIGLSTLVIVVAVPLLLYLGIPFAFILILAVICGLAIFLLTYFLLVIRAYYYEIKKASGQVHVALNEENA